jgi:cytochrome c biogenesis protein CcmG/thiol:disulfide interchange protein DsbE
MLTPARLFLSAGLLTLAMAVVLAVPSMLSGRISNYGVGAVSGPNPGNLAPGFSLADASTGSVTGLSALKGSPVWLNFWATWCPGCKDEMPLIERVYQKHRASGLQVVGINVQESPETVRSFIRANSFMWTFLLDSGGRTADLYYVNGLPYHVFIGADGIIKAVHPGILDEKSMNDYINQIMPDKQ